jgi:hypothetical protein
LQQLLEADIAASLLPGVPAGLILETYGSAPGNEIASGKFTSPESSAALVANAFGPFVARPAELQPLPGGEAWGWPASSVRLEAMLRFPWSGGRHPCLDALIETPSALIGVESKRYEPFRAKAHLAWPDAYRRPVWGDAMTGYEGVRDAPGVGAFALLNASQLVKHAFALRTAVHRDERFLGRQPVLLYLYAEPRSWPDGRPVSRIDIKAHRAEIESFAKAVGGDEVVFRACSYRELLAAWAASSDAAGGRVTSMMRLVLLWWIRSLPSAVGRMWRMMPA